MRPGFPRSVAGPKVAARSCALAEPTIPQDSAFGQASSRFSKKGEAADMPPAHLHPTRVMVGYPLTAPVNPRTNCRCKTTNSTRIGTTVMTTPAAMPRVSEANIPCSATRPT